MERIILPINDKPSIYTCIHHAYPIAIIESKELAWFYLPGFLENGWEKDLHGTSVLNENDFLTVLDVSDGKETDTVLWRKCNDEDEVILNIRYLRSNDTSWYVDLFLFTDDLQKEVNCEDKTFGVRWNPYGLFIGKTMYCFDTKIYVHVKIKICEEGLNGYISKDGIDWENIDLISIPDRRYGNKLGIHMHSGANGFNVWKKMNMIQLVYNEANLYKGIYLDYFCFPRKNIDNSYSWFVNFLDSYYDVSYEVLDCFASIHEYIKWNICHFYYLALCLDEMYIQDRQAYKKVHYNHYNLFFGFDDNKQVYYVMGYGVNSTPVLSEIPYDIFSKNVITSEKITRYKLNTNIVTPLRYNIKAVKDSLYEFVNNIDSSEKYSSIITNEKVFYGLSILQRLANTEEGRKNIQRDKRIAYCLFEHSRLMRERIEYMYNIGCINDNNYPDIIHLAEEAVQVSNVLLINILKNRFIKVDVKKICEGLLSLYAVDKELCQRLIGSL